MQEATTLPAKRPEPPPLRTQLERMTPEFRKALPGHISAERFVRTAQTAIALTRNIDRLRSPQSLMAACTKAASDGLILDGREAAIVIDYHGEAQYRPMMRGLLKLAYQSGEIKGLVVEVVCRGDLFRHRPTNLAEPITHEITHDAERGEPRVVYALAELKDGGIVHEVMSVFDINRIRDRSDAYKAFKAGKIKSTPWSTDWAEMARKTVFRRLSKYLPSSNDRSTLHQASERVDEDFARVIDAEPVTDAEQVKQPVRAAPKKRGGAAAVLKATKQQQQAQPPAKEVGTEREPVIEREPGDEFEVDPSTGEIFDAAPLEDFPGDERFPGDDI